MKVDLHKNMEYCLSIIDEFRNQLKTENYVKFLYPVVYLDKNGRREIFQKMIFFYFHGSGLRLVKLFLHGFEIYRPIHNMITYLF